MLPRDQVHPLCAHDGLPGVLHGPLALWLCRRGEHPHQQDAHLHARRHRPRDLRLEHVPRGASRRAAGLPGPAGVRVRLIILILTRRASGESPSLHSLLVPSCSFLAPSLRNDESYPTLASAPPNARAAERENLVLRAGLAPEVRVRVRRLDELAITRRRVRISPFASPLKKSDCHRHVILAASRPSASRPCPTPSTPPSSRPTRRSARRAAR